MRGGRRAEGIRWNLGQEHEPSWYGDKAGSCTGVGPRKGTGGQAAGSKGVGGQDWLQVCFFPADPTAGRGSDLLAWMASVER
jgi:hypothetical protein